MALSEEQKLWNQEAAGSTPFTMCFLLFVGWTFFLVAFIKILSSGLFVDKMTVIKMFSSGLFVDNKTIQATVAAEALTDKIISHRQHIRSCTQNHHLCVYVFCLFFALLHSGISIPFKQLKSSKGAFSVVCDQEVEQAFSVVRNQVVEQPACTQEGKRDKFKHCSVRFPVLREPLKQYCVHSI